jgi:hypothetical protein
MNIEVWGSLFASDRHAQEQMECKKTAGTRSNS